MYRLLSPGQVRLVMRALKQEVLKDAGFLVCRIPLVLFVVHNGMFEHNAQQMLLLLEQS